MSIFYNQKKILTTKAIWVTYPFSNLPLQGAWGSQ